MQYTPNIEPQYIDNIQSDTIPPGIKKLCQAVLIGSLSDVAKKNQYSVKALGWLFSNNISWVFSFLSVCKILQLDPAKIRACINTDLLSRFLAGYKKAQLYGIYFNMLI